MRCKSQPVVITMPENIFVRIKGTHMVGRLLSVNDDYAFIRHEPKRSDESCPHEISEVELIPPKEFKKELQWYRRHMSIKR